MTRNSNQNESDGVSGAKDMREEMLTWRTNEKQLKKSKGDTDVRQ